MNSTKLHDVLAVSIAEAARQLGLSTRTVATLITSGELESRKVGRRRLIPLSALVDFVNRDHATTQKVCDCGADPLV